MINSRFLFKMSFILARYLGGDNEEDRIWRASVTADEVS